MIPSAEKVSKRAEQLRVKAKERLVSRVQQQQEAAAKVKAAVDAQDHMIKLQPEGKIAVGEAQLKLDELTASTAKASEELKAAEEAGKAANDTLQSMRNEAQTIADKAEAAKV